MGRPSLEPGRYFRLFLVGYFEGIDSERGIAWRATDSLAIRSVLRLPVDEPPPDHSTLSRTRRLIDVETHLAVFTWVQQRLVEEGLFKGKTIAIDNDINLIAEKPDETGAHGCHTPAASIGYWSTARRIEVWRNHMLTSGCQ